VIVDDFTGRLMPGRRFSEGLHQAIEAKEGVQVRRENVTMATITFQNYFRMYEKLSGMTGTAATEAPEFEKIYNIDVVAIPTNVPVARIDNDDFIYMNQNAKWNAVTEEIRYRTQKNQPVLVGTVAIETSELLSKRLKKAGIEHEVLNAKQHFREAEIIAQAGRPGAVTIATNMAGRGVDIKLGGNAEGLARAALRQQGVDLAEVTDDQWRDALKEASERVKQNRETVVNAGGLFILGTERHEARRIDNQLRGRSGRQGEPGESRFYLSLEDDLMKRFNAEAVKRFMSWANLPENEPIEHGMISKSIEQAQVRVEGHNFDIRKRVLEYDDVVNRQREQIYGQRRAWLFDEPDVAKQKYFDMIEEQIRDVLEYSDEGGTTVADWDVELLYRDLLAIFPVPAEINADTMVSMTRQQLETALIEAARKAISAKQAELDRTKEGLMDSAMRITMLRAIDTHWQRHLTALDMLREGIGLMGVMGRDPVVEYQIQGSQMFNELQEQIAEQATNQIFRVQPQLVTPVRRATQATLRTTAGAAVEQQSKPQPVKKQQNIGPNDPCYCGSGKKYKKCHYITDKQGQNA
jgi:preprotein translocase subunit SecA